MMNDVMEGNINRIRGEVISNLKGWQMDNQNLIFEKLIKEQG